MVIYLPMFRQEKPLRCRRFEFCLDVNVENFVRTEFIIGYNFALTIACGTNSHKSLDFPASTLMTSVHSLGRASTICIHLKNMSKMSKKSATKICILECRERG